MSYLNSSLPVARFVANWAKTDISFGATKAVVQASLLNSKISVQDLQDSPGKKRMFKLTYYAPNCDVLGNCSDTICNTGTKVEPKQAYFDLSRCTASKVYELDADDIRLVDDGGMTFSQHAQAQFAATMVSMRKVLDQQILAILIANIGLLPDGNSTVQINLTDVNGAPNPLGFWSIDKAFADGFYNNPYIIGGNQAFLAMKSKSMAGMASTGLNLGETDYHNLFYDPLLNGAFGDGKQHIIAFDPQVLKFIGWNMNAGMFSTDLNGLGDFSQLFRRGVGTAIHGTLVDPVYPITWDFDAHYDECTMAWSYRIRLYWDIFMLPPDVCNLQGVNGIFGFTTCDPVILPCPTGTPYPTPPASKTFSWTPTITYPLTITSMQIGSTKTMPNVNAANLDAVIAVMNDSASGVKFIKSGSAITYTGNTAIPGNINGTLTFAFA